MCSRYDVRGEAEVGTNKERRNDQEAVFAM